MLKTANTSYVLFDDRYSAYYERSEPVDKMATVFSHIFTSLYERAMKFESYATASRFLAWVNKDFSQEFPHDRDYLFKIFEVKEIIEMCRADHFEEGTR